MVMTAFTFEQIVDSVINYIYTQKGETSTTTSTVTQV